jgi:hypothetical protein
LTPHIALEPGDTLACTHTLFCFTSLPNFCVNWFMILRHISSVLRHATQCTQRKRWRSVFLELWQYLQRLFVKILAMFIVHTWILSTRGADISSISLSQREGRRLKKSKNKNIWTEVIKLNSSTKKKKQTKTVLRLRSYGIRRHDGLLKRGTLRSSQTTNKHGVISQSL